jgi:putative membrane protein
MLSHHRRFPVVDPAPQPPDPPHPEPDFDPAAITRPDPKLLTYYILVSLLSSVGIVPISLLIFLPLYFKYRTLQYRFDEEGIAVSWGLLFKREVHLTHRRIQDIHVTRNVIQRWMGLATVAIQTASGSATPEMKIEGILQAAELRDFLYMKMRGARDEDGSDEDGGGDGPTPGQEALALLHEIHEAVGHLGSGDDGPRGGEQQP